MSSSADDDLPVSLDILNDASNNATGMKALAMSIRRPPSHILADGTFVKLPEPTPAEKAVFFARSVAERRLVSANAEDATVDPDSSTKKNEDDDDRDDVAPRVHPVAVSSARLHGEGGGVPELSKAINLGNLVGAGEYFALATVVRRDDRTSSSTSSSSSDKGAVVVGPAGAAAVGAASAVAVADASTSDPSVETDPAAVVEELRTRASYTIRRKRKRLEAAAATTARHRRLLAASARRQRVVDRRLVHLRRDWRLVAPEHPVRATGPASATGIVAVDVEVYDRNRTGGGTTTTTGGSGGTSRMGRVSRVVPRYATIELSDEYHERRRRGEEIFKKSKEEEKSYPPLPENLTRAEPFAVADATLGKIDPDFDPDKVPVLTLLVRVEKPSTGYAQNRTLTAATLDEDGESERRRQRDERVVVALQHSLFCASLFESIRREIATGGGDGNDDGPHNHSSRRTVWSSSESERAFSPPTSLLAGGGGGGRGGNLCVVHCHESEVKVRLDEEYALTVRLVEAGTATHETTAESGSRGKNDDDAPSAASGSQTPAQLGLLCRILLLQAQTVYHEHSMATHNKRPTTTTKTNDGNDEKKKDEKETPATAKKRRKRGAVANTAKKRSEADEPSSPRILEKCVALGAKIGFERKIRRALQRTARWIASINEANTARLGTTTTRVRHELDVEWLPLPLLDPRSDFVVCATTTTTSDGDGTVVEERSPLTVDATIRGDALTATQIGADDGVYQRAVFGSAEEFESYLRFQIDMRVLRTHPGMNANANANANDGATGR